MGSLVGAALALSACASVLTTMNSTPSRPKLIIVLTALPPEPPHADDLDARLVRLRLVRELDRETHRHTPPDSSSSRRARRLLPCKGAACRGPSTRSRFVGGARHSSQAQNAALIHSQKPDLRRSDDLDGARTARRAGARRRRGPIAAPAASAASATACAPYFTSPTPVAYSRPVDELRDALDAGRHADADRHAEDLLGELAHALQQHGAAGEHDAGAQLLEHARCPRCACGPTAKISSTRGSMMSREHAARRLARARGRRRRGPRSPRRRPPCGRARSPRGA